VVSVLAGVLAGVVAAPRLGGDAAAMISWVAAAAVFLGWTWASIWVLGPRQTAWIAQREDGSRSLRDLVLLAISICTVLTVALVIFPARENPPQRTALGVACVAASWLVLNTVFTLRYARQYYSDPPGGVDFNGDADPTFRDFAYLAFTIGMTFQVSDTTLQTTQIRATALRHAVTSFVFDVVIIAMTVNVLGGLST
jgi:uncharacterized membrane protein